MGRCAPLNESTKYLSLSRLNYWLPRGQAHPDIVQGTTDCHDQIADAGGVAQKQVCRLTHPGGSLLVGPRPQHRMYPGIRLSLTSTTRMQHQEPPICFQVSRGEVTRGERAGWNQGNRLWPLGFPVSLEK